MQKTDKFIDLRLFLQTLLPSTASAIVSVLIGVVISIGVIFLTRYKNSSIRQGYLTYSHTHHLALGFLDKSIFSTGIFGNSLIFAFWLVAGIFVYVMAVDLVKGFKNTIDVGKEMAYVNLDRVALLRYTVIRLVIRIITIIIWAPYIYEFIHKILPYAIYLSIVASSASHIINIPLYVILSVAIISVAMHINLIFLRLVLLRTRVFNKSVA